MELMSLFVASVIGSVHCAGMCGPVVAFCSKPNSCGSSQAQDSVSVIFYHLGRLFTYLVMAMLATFVGHSLNHIGVIVGFQKGAAIVMGALLLVYGLKTFIGQGGVSGVGQLPKFFRKGLRLVQNHDGGVQKLLLGMLTGLLPCGWLYSFLALAAAKADFFQAGIVIFVFWLGTVPALLALGGTIRLLLSRFKLSAQRVTGLLIMFSGLISISFHFMMMHGGHH